MALNAEAFNLVIAKAKKVGIPFVLIDTDAPKSGRDAYIGTSNVTGGRFLGNLLVKLTGGEAKIGLMTGALDAPNMIERMDGFKKVIAEYPQIVIVDLQADNSDLMQCIDKGHSMLLAHPEITSLVGTEGYGVPGLGKVVKEAGKVGEITVFGFDDLTETINFIREGVAQGTVVQRQYLMGYLAAKYLYKLAQGEKVPEITDTGVVVVTKDNADTYKKEIEQAIEEYK